MIRLEDISDEEEHRMVGALLRSLLQAGWKSASERSDVQYRDGFVALRHALREAPSHMFGITHEGE